MLDLKKLKIFLILLILIGSGIGVLNTQVAPYLQKLYHQNDFATLNQLAGVNENKDFDFYTGVIEERWGGPLTVALSAFLFSLFCIWFLKEAGFKVFALAVFLFLILTKFFVLFYPPYGDAIGGPFAEAIWLKENHFNYAGLLHQPGYAQGGPKVYFFTIYPGFLALLMTILPHIKMFLAVNHLIVFGLSAVIVAVSREIMRKVFEPPVALLSSILILFLPLFQSQSEAINMEIPTLFFSILAVYYLVNHRFGWAMAMAMSGALIKGHAVSICAVVFMAAVCQFFISEDKSKGIKDLIFGLCSIVFGFLVVGVKFFLKDQHASAGMIRPLAGWPSLVGMGMFYLYIICLSIFIGVIIWEVKGHWHGMKSIMEKYYISGINFLAAGMWFALFLNFFAVSPRYRLLAAPFLVFCLIFTIVLFVRKVRAVQAILIFLIMFSCVTSYGFLHSPKESDDAVILERSLEYRNDLKMYMRLARFFENNFQGYTIGAPFIVAQMLAMPQMGYVQSPKDVVLYGMNCVYGGVKNFSGLQNLNVAKTIWIALKMDANPKFEFPLGSADKVIGRIIVGKRDLVLFVGGFSIQRMWLFVKQVRQNAKFK